MALRAHLVNPGKSPRLKTLNEITAAQLQRPLSPDVFAIEGNSHVSQGCGLGYLGGQYSANHRLVKQRVHSGGRGEPRREAEKASEGSGTRRSLQWPGWARALALWRELGHMKTAVWLCVPLTGQGKRSHRRFRAEAGLDQVCTLERSSLPLQGGRLQVGTQGKPIEREDLASPEGVAVKMRR